VLVLAGADSSAPVAADKPSVVTDDPRDPSAPHPPGIYYFREAGNQRQVTRIEPASYAKQRDGYSFYGASGRLTKQRLAIGPAHAALQITEQRPLLYLYCGESPSDPNQAIFAGPEEFILVPLDVTESKSRRVLDFAKVGLTDGVHTYTSEVASRGFAAEKIAAGVFRITPQRDLREGEYCFIRQISRSGTIFGFGIKGDQTPNRDK